FIFYRFSEYGLTIRGTPSRDYTEHKYGLGDLLPEPASLPTNALLVELMGPGELYRSLQQEGLKISGIAVTLTDLRNIRTRLFDYAHKNSFVTGDILDKRTWIKLDRRLAGRQADLIVCSPGGGDVSIPKSTRVYAGLLDRTYRLLGPDGRLVTDVPAEFKPYFDQLEESCREHNILFEKKRIPPYSEVYNGSMMIQKTERSPKTLMNIFADISHL
ncbi:MAG: hypothetical protein AAB481_04915, partial [Patescibacteria group bacterium]